MFFDIQPAPTYAGINYYKIVRACYSLFYKSVFGLARGHYVVLYQ